MKDTRTLAQVAKAITTMRRKVASIVKKHQALQVRIQKLVDAGRVVLLSKDGEIYAGDGCHYVKAASLNTNPDATENYYYTVICDEHGYQCGCESRQIGNCKHIIALSAYFHEEMQERQRQEWMETATVSCSQVEVKVGSTTICAHKDNIDNALAHHQWGRDMVALMHEAPTNRENQGFSILRKAS